MCVCVCVCVSAREKGNSPRKGPSTPHTRNRGKNKQVRERRSNIDGLHFFSRFLVLDYPTEREKGTGKGEGEGGGDEFSTAQSVSVSASSSHPTLEGGPLPVPKCLPLIHPQNLLPRPAVPTARVQGQVLPRPGRTAGDARVVCSPRGGGGGGFRVHNASPVTWRRRPCLREGEGGRKRKEKKKQIYDSNGVSCCVLWHVVVFTQVSDSIDVDTRVAIPFLHSWRHSSRTSPPPPSGFGGWANDDDGERTNERDGER